jgi:hypothetical protein
LERLWGIKDGFYKGNTIIVTSLTINEDGVYGQINKIVGFHALETKESILCSNLVRIDK